MANIGFTGGNDLFLHLHRVVADMRAHDYPHVMVGFLDANKKAGPNRVSAPALAVLQEFGGPATDAGYIPPRPFFRNYIMRSKKEWLKIIAWRLKTSRFNADKTLVTVGRMMANGLKESIDRSEDYKENKPWAIKAKGTTQMPLKYTFRMKRAISFKVNL